MISNRIRKCSAHDESTLYSTRNLGGSWGQRNWENEYLRVIKGAAVAHDGRLNNEYVADEYDVNGKEKFQLKTSFTEIMFSQHNKKLSEKEKTSFSLFVLVSFQPAANRFPPTYFNFTFISRTYLFSYLR